MPTVQSEISQLLRDWRGHRHLSQLDLASAAGVSTRHLSFIETGRSRPSPEMILTLARSLDVPLREQNRLLLAAGYAPRYPETPIDDSASRHVRAAIDRVLAAHNPFPGLVVDRNFNLVTNNDAAAGLIAAVDPRLLAEAPNLYRISLHPDGMAQATTNFDDWAPHLVRQLAESAQRSASPEVVELLDEVRGYPNVAALDLEPGDDPGRQLTLNVELDTPIGHLSLFTTLTTFGSPLDVTVDELLIELFYPADDLTETLLRS